MNKSKQSEILSLPMIPLRDAVLFPGMMMPFLVGRESSLKALELALGGDRTLFFAAQHSARTLNPEMEDIYSVGTIGTIVESLKCDDGNMKILIEGVERARVLDYRAGDYFSVTVKLLNSYTENAAELAKRMEEALALLEQYSRAYPGLMTENILPQKVNEAGRFADLLVSCLQLELEQKQDLLETANPSERLRA